MEEGIVYILTNPAMPGLVKIGMTTRLEVEIRMSELYSTGVPVPFQCSFAGRVVDVKKVEKAFHKAFGPYRINPNREFFEIEDEQAIGLLELICVEDVTPQVSQELEKVDEASKNAGKQYARKKRPHIDFIEMGIPLDSKLMSNVTDEFCVVESNKKVRFRGEVVSLTRATKILLENEYNVAPGPYWTFEGRRIREIYNETYGSLDD